MSATAAARRGKGDVVSGSGALIGIAVPLGLVELYLLLRYFRRDRPVTGLACAHDRSCELGHLIMTAAMIGMLVPVLNPLPPVGWAAVFLGGAGWFGRQALRAAEHRAELTAAGLPGPGREAHHVLANLTMTYLVLALPMVMPGAGGSTADPHLLPALAIAPALRWAIAAYFLGHAALSAYRVAVPARRSTAAPPILLSPRALSACQAVMATGMIVMVA